MSVVVHGLQSRRRKMRIHLRRRKRLVAEQLLHAAEVRSAVEHVSGEAMPQRVRADGGIQSALGQVLVEFAADASSAQTLPVLVDEERALIEIGGSCVSTAQLQVFLDCRQRRGPYRRRPLLLALAANPNRLPFEIQVREVHIHQFADPHAGGEQHFEHGPVAGAQEGVVVGRGQQLGDLLHFEELRQPLFLLGRAYRGQWMGLYKTPPQAEFVEAAQRRQLAGHGGLRIVLSSEKRQERFDLFRVGIAEFLL